jgi:hypothetical protein
MTIEIFERELAQALIRKGRATAPNEILIRDAWNAFGHRQSDGFIESALYHLARNKESNLPTAFEQARTHAIQRQMRDVAKSPAGQCTTCDGNGWHYILTRKTYVTYSVGGKSVRDDLDQPAICRVAYRCPSCNGGKIPPMDLGEGKCFDQETGMIMPTGRTS